MVRIISVLLSSMIVLQSSPAFSDSVQLDAGQKAPFAGWLSTSNNEQKVNDYKLLTDSLNKSIDLYKANEALKDDKIQILTKDNLSLYDAVKSSQMQSDLQKILYFGLGVAITSLAIWGASKIRQ